jgi:hypothetical protein
MWLYQFCKIKSLILLPQQLFWHYVLCTMHETVLTLCVMYNFISTTIVLTLCVMYYAWNCYYVLCTMHETVLTLCVMYYARNCWHYVLCTMHETALTLCTMHELDLFHILCSQPALGFMEHKYIQIQTDRQTDRLRPSLASYEQP